MANKHFSTDFDLIPDVKANDTFLVEDADDGVVKKCHPSQVWQKFADLDTSVAAAAQSASDAANSESNALSYKNDAAQARTDAQTAQGLAEGARDDAQRARDDAQDARDAAQTAQTAAETAQGLAEDARDAAAASAIVAGDKADDAAASASSAATSADDAATAAAQASGVMLANVVSANAYGIEFYDTGAGLSVTRVADDMTLHKALISKGLPVQKQMRRFLQADDGANNGFLLGSDSRYKANGSPADLSGTDGQVMVTLPRWYQHCSEVGTAANGKPIFRYLMLDAQVVDAYVRSDGGNPLADYLAAHGWTVSERLDFAAFLMADKSSSRSLGSAAGTSVCAKDRIAFLDAYGLVVRESGNIEYPNHSISDGSHRKYSSSRSGEAAATLRRPSFAFTLTSAAGAPVNTSADLAKGRVFLLTDTESDGAVRNYLLRNDSGAVIASGTAVSVDTFAALGLTDVGDWHGHLEAAQQKLNWLFAVEYATFHWQKAFNAAVDANGYRQGGLGEGFTSGLDFMGDGSSWSNNNAYAVPNGCTLGLGNESGEVDFYPSEEGQAMRRWATNRATALPSVEVVATANGAAGTTTEACAVGGFVIVRNTVGSSTSDVVLQNTSGAVIAAGASVDFASGGTGFTRHAKSDTDYVYCIVEYGNIGVPSTSVPASGIILPVGANIFVQNYNGTGLGKLFVFTQAVTADGTSTIADYISGGQLIEAIADKTASVQVGQLVFDYATMGDASTARGYWRCTAAGTFGTNGTGAFVYVQDEYHYPHINSYRGVEFPFGYVWQCATDILYEKNSDGTAKVWKADPKYLKAVISNNSVLVNVNSYRATMTAAYKGVYLDGKRWREAGQIPAGNGYIKEVGLGETAETQAKAVGGGASTYFADYFYAVTANTNAGELTVALLGGDADHGSYAGGFHAYAHVAVGYANAAFGSRLCHE